MKNKIREFYTTFISLQGNPRKIAMGMAIGVFIGMTPTIPFHTVLIIGATMIFRQNMTAALLGSWIMNPFTIPFFYVVEYEIGKIVLGLQHLDIALTAYTLDEILEVGWHIFCPLQVGGVILAPVFAVPAYFITRKAILAVRKRNERNNNPEGSPQETRNTTA